MVIGIIVTHGRLAEELLSTAKVIYGNFEGCFAVTNSAKSPQALLDEIHSLIDGNQESRCIVLTDFFGGSCCHVCMKLRMERDDVPVITGVNLPMILAFLNKRDTVPFDGLPGEIIGRGHHSIQLIDPESF
ncbi:MAG: PTS mannose transporter subunit IID [Candidatus Latescibacterota bacterium]|nr:MAG: PTS mannose transporter subunit IID [Candidatus Latescibacterota bacterium]